MMLIGELCRLSGLSRDGLRYYESLGLIRSSPRQAGSRTYRDYHDDSPARLELIRCGKSAGFSLKEIEQFLDAFLSGELDNAQTRELLNQKMAQLEQRQEAIAQMQAVLEERIASK